MSSGKIKQKFILDFDDLSPTSPGLDQLQKMKEHFPTFKCTCFTPAFNPQILTRNITTNKMKEWFKLISDYDWIEIAPHGFIHEKGECMVKDKQAGLIMIDAIENIFTEAGVNFIKVFKAPYWLWNKQFEEALYERGYTVAIDRNNPQSFTDAPKYVWNWSIDNPIPEYHTIKGHGHVYGTNNGIDICLPNLLRIPQSAEFLTIGEYLKLNEYTHNS